MCLIWKGTETGMNYYSKLLIKKMTKLLEKLINQNYVGAQITINYLLKIYINIFSSYQTCLIVF